MGVYVFKTDVLLKLLRWSYPNCNDFGSEIIPSAVRDHNVQVRWSFGWKFMFILLNAIRRWIQHTSHYVGDSDYFYNFRHICSMIIGKTLEPSSRFLMPTWPWPSRLVTSPIQTPLTFLSNTLQEAFAIETRNSVGELFCNTFYGRTHLNYV